jgi:hypothetical protein
MSASCDAGVRLEVPDFHKLYTDETSFAREITLIYDLYNAEELLTFWVCMETRRVMRLRRWIKEYEKYCERHFYKYDKEFDVYRKRWHHWFRDKVTITFVDYNEIYVDSMMLQERKES